MKVITLNLDHLVKCNRGTSTTQELTRADKNFSFQTCLWKTLLHQALQGTARPGPHFSNSVLRKKENTLTKEIFQFGITLLTNYITVLSSLLFPLFPCNLSGTILTYRQILQLGIKLLKPPFLLHAAEEQLLTQKCSTMLLLGLSEAI